MSTPTNLGLKDRTPAETLGSNPEETEARLKNALDTIRDQNAELDKAAKYRYQLNSEKKELINELNLQKNNLRSMLGDVWASNSDSEDHPPHPPFPRHLSVQPTSPSGGGTGGRPLPHSFRRATTFQSDNQRMLHSAQREGQDYKTRLAKSEIRLSELEAKHETVLQTHAKALRKLDQKLVQTQQAHKNTQKTVDMLHEERERLIQRHHKEIKLVRDRLERDLAELQSSFVAQEARFDQRTVQLQNRNGQLEAQLRMVQMQKSSLEENVHDLVKEFTEKIARIEELEQLVEIGDQYREQYEQQTEAMQALQVELEDSRTRLQMRLTPSPSPAASSSSLHHPPPHHHPSQHPAPGTANQASFIRSEYPFVEVSDDEYIQSQGRGPRRPHNREQRLVRRAVTQSAQQKTRLVQDLATPHDGPALSAVAAVAAAAAAAQGQGNPVLSLQNQKEALERETDRLIQTLGAAIASRGKAIFTGPLNSWGKNWLARNRSASSPGNHPGGGERAAVVAHGDGPKKGDSQGAKSHRPSTTTTGASSASFTSAPNGGGGAKGGVTATIALDSSETQCSSPPKVPPTSAPAKLVSADIPTFMMSPPDAHVPNLAVEETAASVELDPAFASLLGGDAMPLPTTSLDFFQKHQPPSPPPGGFRTSVGLHDNGHQHHYLHPSHRGSGDDHQVLDDGYMDEDILGQSMVAHALTTSFQEYMGDIPQGGGSRGRRRSSTSARGRRGLPTKRPLAPSRAPESTAALNFSALSMDGPDHSMLLEGAVDTPDDGDAVNDDVIPKGMETLASIKALDTWAAAAGPDSGHDDPEHGHDSLLDNPNRGHRGLPTTGGSAKKRVTISQEAVGPDGGDHVFPNLTTWLRNATPLVKVAHHFTSPGHSPPPSSSTAAHPPPSHSTGSQVGGYYDSAAAASSSSTTARERGPLHRRRIPGDKPYHSAPNSSRTNLGHTSTSHLNLSTSFGDSVLGSGSGSGAGAPRHRPVSTYERLIRWLMRFLSTLYRWFKFICFLVCGFALVLLEGPNGTFGKRYIS
ncbi:hypothetical protein BJ085DRAFT_28888 [Dimargaris cristalligena]|uniref:Uncharacterized protein n=1 Tax=Dimargaris cristalligena TaxID=215637 RepID=A0A4P9ZPF4_9FUNG|nr:hypothetical protein BJ085DRAFT_28888 [Dimargaris cristalligena]|eukprot:RKP35115.1 hypothetical protein BJ085DRAFT_28888 [Dimargaris cristalligena]